MVETAKTQPSHSKRRDVSRPMSIPKKHDWGSMQPKHPQSHMQKEMLQPTAGLEPTAFRVEIERATVLGLVMIMNELLWLCLPIAPRGQVRADLSWERT